MLPCSTWLWRRKLSCGDSSGTVLSANTSLFWIEVPSCFNQSFSHHLLNSVVFTCQVSAWWKDDSVLQEQLQWRSLAKGSFEKCFLPPGRATLWTICCFLPIGWITQRCHRGLNDMIFLKLSNTQDVYSLFQLSEEILALSWFMDTTLIINLVCMINR